MPGQLCSTGGGIRNSNSNVGGILVPDGGSGTCGCSVPLQLQTCAGVLTNYFVMSDSRLRLGVVVGAPSGCFVLVAFTTGTTLLPSTDLSVMTGNCVDARCSGGLLCDVKLIADTYHCCWTRRTTADISMTQAGTGNTVVGSGLALSYGGGSTCTGFYGYVAYNGVTYTYPPYRYNFELAVSPSFGANYLISEMTQLGNFFTGSVFAPGPGCAGGPATGTMGWSGTITINAADVTPTGTACLLSP